MNLEILLHYLLPPLVGALIGGVTNYIAIRMLFRPLKPWRILGFRLPLTPGIIPARRGELAAKLGRTVGTHLVTAREIHRTLEKPEFQQELRRVIDGKLEALFNMELGPLESLFPVSQRSLFLEITDLIENMLVKTVFDYAASDDFRTRIYEFTHNRSSEYLGQDLGEYLTADKYQALRGHVEENVKKALKSQAVAAATAYFVDEKFEQAARSEKTLREILPEDVVNLLFSFIDEKLPLVLDKLSSILDDAVVRKRLISYLESAIDQFLDSLTGFSGWLAGFVNMEKLHAQIPEFLDKAGEEISQWLDEECTKEEIAQLLKGKANTFLDQPVNVPFNKISYEKIDSVRRFIKEKLQKIIASNETAAFIVTRLDRAVQRLNQRSLRSLLKKVLPEEKLRDAEDRIADAIINILTSQHTEDLFRTLLHEKISWWLFERRLGRLEKLVPLDLQQRLPALLHTQLLDILRREFPSLLDALNVERMVEEKVNALPILEVENLLLEIMRRHLVYINLFGALLGFLIGLINIFL